MNKVVISAAKRTPIGTFLGSLSKVPAPELGSIVLKNIIAENNLPPDSVDEVIMGNVLSAGIGQAPARQTALKSGLHVSTECLTINKMCGSGLKSVMLAHQSILLDDAQLVFAGGIENMSLAPHLLMGARTGIKMGNAQVEDSMIKDGLWDVYNNIHMGSCAETCAKDFNMRREEVDEFAILSYKRALEAQKAKKFNDEIVKVTIPTRKGEVIVEFDEEPGNVNFDKIPNLRPVFEKDGVVTAANASSINDGAAAVLVSSEGKAKELGLKPMVEIVAQSSAARAPMEFTTAPADAINKVLKKANLSIDDIGLFEINEAFSVVSLANNKLLNLNPEKVNVNGGAIALGHPIGASGARILVTLIHEMKKKNIEYGIAALCIGGGEASAVIVKNYQ